MNSVAIFVPYFNDLTAITGALSITPLSFVLPIVFWSRVHGTSAPMWRKVFHCIFVASFGLMGVAALIGACYEIQDKASSGQ